ncbi:MAG TPA: RNA-binding protein [Terriglobales bacterium]|jgi:RNA recognition motif-containing protein
MAQKLMTNIFVGNLDPNVTEGQLLTLFSRHGVVESSTIVLDRDTGRSRGFAFVEMSEVGDAQAAVMSLDGAFLNGRPLRVNEARPKLVPDLRLKLIRRRNHRRHRI